MDWLVELASISEVEGHMWSWVENGKAYETVTSAALLIGFLSTVAMNYWPEFAVWAAVVMVLATAVAVTTYFAARCRQACVAADGEDTAKAQQEASLQQETPADHRGATEVAATDRGIVTADLLRKVDLLARLGAVPTPDALREVTRAANTARLLKTYRSTVHSALWEKSTEHLFLRDFSNYLTAATRLRDEVVHSSYIFNPRSIQRMIDIERLVQQLDRRQPEKPTNPVVVKIGPVTVEITDEETRVHVESAKPVVTNVSGPRRPRGDDEIPRIENAEGRPIRVIH